MTRSSSTVNTKTKAQFTLPREFDNKLYLFISYTFQPAFSRIIVNLKDVLYFFMHKKPVISLYIFFCHTSQPRTHAFHLNVFFFLNLSKITKLSISNV